MSILEEVHKIFTARDFKVFKWVFCRYMCESSKDTFTDYKLFLRSNLKAFMGDEKLMKAYVLDKQENIYQVFVNEVMNSLVQKGLLKKVRWKDRNGQKIQDYKKTQKLTKKCPKFLEYLLGDIDSVI